MLQNPSKCCQNPLSQFFVIHSSQSISQSVSIKNEMENETKNQTHLDSLNGSIGKSFTIAAILGLKKNAAASMEHHRNQKEFSVMNLSLNNHNIMKNSYNNRHFDDDNTLLNSTSRLPINLQQNFSSQVHSSHQQHSNIDVIHHLHQQIHQQHSGSSTFHGREKTKEGK